MRAPAPHGSYSRYSNGCKDGEDGKACEACREAKREYMNRRKQDAIQRRRNFEAANPDKPYVVYGIKHGGAAASREHLCGCLACGSSRRKRSET